MINFTRGGGGVNMFCRQHGFRLYLVDTGVDHDLTEYKEIINRKIANGTANFRYEDAMTEEQFEQAINIGCEMVDKCVADNGCNIICLGEMGIANTSPSSVWMSLFGNIELEECVGAGAGLDSPGIRHKYEDFGRRSEKLQKQARQHTRPDYYNTLLWRFRDGEHNRCHAACGRTSHYHNG